MRNALIIIGCILYVLSPIDLLPDVIVVLGWIDDLIVIGASVKAVKDGAE